MKGSVRTKETCPSCGEQFKHVKKKGLYCSACDRAPKKLFIDICWAGTRYKLYSDSKGKPIDSNDRAFSILAEINTDIKNLTFNPKNYTKAEQERYWTGSLLDKFHDYKITDIAPSYQRHYKRMIELAKGYFGTRDITEIRKLDLINYKEYLEKLLKVSPKSIKNIMDNFKTFMYFCKNDLEVIHTVPNFPAFELTEYRYKWLQPEDQIKIIERINEKDRPIMVFLMLQGCRPSEGRALKCKDVDLHSRTITIRATFSDDIYREKRKGRKSKAVTIPIHPEMMDYINNKVKNNLPEAFVFSNPRTGRAYTESSLDRVWRTVKVALGITNVRLYDATRHSVASQLVNSGSSLFKVSRLLGHSSTKMTEKYSHEHVESLRADLEKLSLQESKKVITSISKKAAS